ncbi:MAG: hypothetical protein ACYDDA_08115 [Acidiferrobacteraceae bacterium]
MNEIDEHATDEAIVQRTAHRATADHYDRIEREKEIADDRKERDRLSLGIDPEHDELVPEL